MRPHCESGDVFITLPHEPRVLASPLLRFATGWLNGGTLLLHRHRLNWLPRSRLVGVQSILLVLQFSQLCLSVSHRISIAHLVGCLELRLGLLKLHGKTLLGLTDQDTLAFLQHALKPDLLLPLFLSEVDGLVAETGCLFLGTTFLVELVLQFLDALLHRLRIRGDLVVLRQFRLHAVRASGLVAILLWSVIDNLHLEVVIVFGLCLLSIHARLYPLGSSTTASTVSSLMSRNSLPWTLKRVPE